MQYSVEFNVKTTYSYCSLMPDGFIRYTHRFRTGLKRDYRAQQLYNESLSYGVCRGGGREGDYGGRFLSLRCEGDSEEASRPRL